MIAPERKQILVVDDEPNLRRVLSAQLSREGYEVHTAPDGATALTTLEEHHIDLVISDLRMPGLDGIQLLRAALDMDPNLPVIVLTAHGTVDNAVEALKSGAFDYITKPFDQDEVRAIVRKALRTREIAATEASSLGELAGDSGYRYGIVGNSVAASELHAFLDRVADTPNHVLICGEGGTGKELVARVLHRHSRRRERPFIKVSCAAIPKDQIDRELFGYEKGAFAGALQPRPGRIELATGGTLFLDDIDALPQETQGALCQVLEQRTLERVGGIRTVLADVRLVAASSVDLKQLAAASEFSEDLFYRLNVAQIRLRPLREREDDAVLIARHFLTKFSARLGKRASRLSGGVEAVLRAYFWPGNIRELENAIERAVLFSDGEEIQASDLPPDLRTREQSPVAEESSGGGEGLKEQVRAAMLELERDLIQKALAQTGGNVTHAARLLKISRKGLQLKMKELGLRDDRTEP